MRVDTAVVLQDAGTTSYLSADALAALRLNDDESAGRARETASRKRVGGDPKGRVGGDPKGRVGGDPKGRVGGDPKGRVGGDPKGRVGGDPKPR